jgi:hypothetical protein
MSKQQRNVDLTDLIVPLVSDIVARFAGAVASGEEILKTEAWLYRTLEANCRVKADLTEAIINTKQENSK